MKRYGYLLLVFSLSLLVATTCDADSGVQRSNLINMSLKNSLSISTFCVGRFLIDVPADSKLSGGNYKYDYLRIKRPAAKSLEDFHRDLNQKEAALRARKHDQDPSILRVSRTPDAESRLFAFWEFERARGLIEIEGYRWIDGTQYFLKAQAGTSPPVEGTMSREELVLSKMEKALSHLRPRLDTEIPAEPGYCFEGGFIASPECDHCCQKMTWT